jgi:UDP-N-acetylenolpyruvoylglucosamine reductase
MKRLALIALLALVAGGTARADVFTVVPDAAAGAPLVLPTSETPNAPGSLLLPAGWTERPLGPAATPGYGELEALWRRAGAAYGIPWQVLGAINKIESNFGRNMGPSSAGAVGWMQFMPETWLRWGMDGDGDRMADPWDPEDGVYSAARYLAAAGGTADLRRSIFAYNHANWYVDDVIEVAATFGEGGGTDFAFGEFGEDLEAAQVAVVQASEALVEARKERKRAAQVEAARLAEVEVQELLSDRLAAHKRATLAGVEHVAVARRVEQLEQALAEAEQALADARARSQAAQFSPAAGTLLAAPTFSGDYVFPVGGGPSVVSVSATHHDYPAADVAAPAGSPLYALARGVVVRSWSYDSRCGIGFTLRTGDGLTWTYCHLAYLEPTVRSGEELEAGEPVVTFSNTDCGFGYRESVFKNKYKGQFVILNVTFRLNKTPHYNNSYGAIEEELRKMNTEVSIRSISQAVINIRSSKLPDPKVIGNAGSFFKNPTVVVAKYNELKEKYPSMPGYPQPGGDIKLAAGWLIEQCGWKGYRKGDAGCHSRQALVLVNYGNARGNEIYELSEEILQSVRSKFGITLEREVNII